jgi:hypothetical protein
MSTRFSGKVGGVAYDDPGEFERAARGLGYCRDGERRASRVRIGTEVAVLIEGETVGGQVWARGDRGCVWLALDNGQYASWRISSGHVQVTDALGHPLEISGRVA